MCITDWMKRLTHNLSNYNRMVFVTTFSFGKELDKSKVDERVYCADFFTSNPTVPCRDFQQFSKKLSSTFNWRVLLSTFNWRAPTFINCADFLLPTALHGQHDNTCYMQKKKQHNNTCNRKRNMRWTTKERILQKEYNTCYRNTSNRKRNLSEAWRKDFANFCQRSFLLSSRQTQL